MLVSRSTQQGQIEEGEREMIDKVFVFGDKDVADVMVAKPDVAAISIDMPPEEVLAVVLDSPYTRYPVFRESLDDIAGVLHVRDLFSAIHDRGLADVELEALLRPAYVVPETKDLASLLQEFRRHEQPLRGGRRRVRRDGRDRDARGPARGDRRRDRGRVRRARGAGRADRRGLVPRRRDVLDRRVQRALRHRPAGRGLPHRRAASSSASSDGRRSPATTSPTTGCASTCSRWRATGSSGSRSRSRSGRSSGVTRPRSTSTRTRSSRPVTGTYTSL